MMSASHPPSLEVHGKSQHDGKAIFAVGSEPVRETIYLITQA